MINADVLSQPEPTHVRRSGLGQGGYDVIISSLSWDLVYKAFHCMSAGEDSKRNDLKDQFARLRLIPKKLYHNLSNLSTSKNERRLLQHYRILTLKKQLADYEVYRMFK